MCLNSSKDPKGPRISENPTHVPAATMEMILAEVAT